MHKDHAGGIFNKDEKTNPEYLSFPNATYYINKKELAFASEQINPSYLNRNFNLLLSSDNIILLDDKGKIGEEIEYEMTGAHSPYHTVFWIKENDEIFFLEEMSHHSYNK